MHRLHPVQTGCKPVLRTHNLIAVTGSFGDFNVGIASGGFLTTMFRWYYGLIYVPWKWLTGERFPADGRATCFNAMDWDLP